MRFIEIESGMRVPVSNEEQDVLDLAKDGITSQDLDERNREVARLLVTRGVMRRVKRDDQIVLLPNDLDQVWVDRR